jgi:hypothetical protein
MEVSKCKYCGSDLKKVAMPPDSKFQTEFLMVCLNDDCDYFKRGWNWMKEKFNVDASYRYQFNPVTGQDGPFPVVRSTDLKDMVIS